jgi:glycosyltransferase involved in cell wall biosynthesis
MTKGSRLRIAFVADTFDDAKAGGVLSARRFVAALRARHDVTVIAAGPPADGRVALPGFYPPAVGGIMREMGFTFAVPRRRPLEAALRQADVVHVQFPFWLGLRAAALARRLGRPLVSAFHVQPENLLYNVGVRSERLAAWLYRLFLARLYELSDVVLCPSAFALEALRQRGLTAPAEVVSNGIAPEFRPAPGPRPRHEGGRHLLLAVGRLAREKRHDVIVEGVRRSRHAARIELVVAGRGPRREAVARAAASLSGPAQVGFLSDEELRAALRAADLLVHASEVELEGMAVLEALGCGTPALIADAPRSAASRLAVGPEFLFRSGDPDHLARRLDALLDEPARLEAARARCLAMAAGRALEDSVRRLEDVYRRAIASRRHVGARAG